MVTKSQQKTHQQRSQRKTKNLKKPKMLTKTFSPKMKSMLLRAVMQKKPQKAMKSHLTKIQKIRLVQAWQEPDPVYPTMRRCASYSPKQATQKWISV